MRRILWTTCSVVAMALAGCSIDSLDVNVSAHDHHPVHRTRVVHIDECHHHHGCGHSYMGGRWVVVDDSPRVVRVQESPKVVRVVEPHHTHKAVVVHEPRVVHVHNDHCGCAWNGQTWIIVGERHRHGPGCGHVYISGRWSIR